MNNKSKEIMTSRNIKTLLFASLIVAMILPFSSMNMAEAITADKKQQKLDRLEEKLQKITQKITTVQNRISQLEENLQKAKSNGNEQHIQKLEDRIDKKSLHLAELEAKYDYVQAKLSDQKEQVSTTKMLIDKVEKRIIMLKAKIAKAEFNGNSDKVEMLTEKLVKAEKRLVKLNDRLDRQYSQDNEDAVASGYEINEIVNAFEKAERYVTYEKSTGYMLVNFEEMRTATNMSEKDTQIVKDFAIVNNKMMDVWLQNISSKLKDEAIELYEAGKFHKIHDSNSDASIQQVIFSDNPHVVFLTDTQKMIPIQSIFGVDEAETVNIATNSDGDYFHACGNYGPSNHHPDNGDTFGSTFSSMAKARASDELDGYHKVSSYASGNYGNDYAKVVDGYGTGCDNGPFRDQIVIHENRGNQLVHNTKEPNSEVFSYPPPDYKFWWRAYVVHWHVIH